jgi:DNA-directed RNA polymerase subunit M/transcription elongation factor TFIIS
MRITFTAPATDLAAYHTGQNTRCIDCHSGPGISGRLAAELLGARNAAAWYLHLAKQPAPLTFGIQDANCLKCHPTVTQRGFAAKENIAVPSGEGEGGGRGETGRPNHWHEQLAQWQAVDPAAASCTSCHGGHATNASAQTGFMDAPTTTLVCNACHVVLRRGRG